MSDQYPIAQRPQLLSRVDAQGVDFMRSLAHLAHTSAYSIEQLASAAGSIWHHEERIGKEPTSEQDMLGLLTRAVEVGTPISDLSGGNITWVVNVLDMLVEREHG